MMIKVKTFDSRLSVADKTCINLALSFIHVSHNVPRTYRQRPNFLPDLRTTIHDCRFRFYRINTHTHTHYIRYTVNTTYLSIDFIIQFCFFIATSFKNITKETNIIEYKRQN